MSRLWKQVRHASLPVGVLSSTNRNSIGEAFRHSGDRRLGATQVPLFAISQAALQQCATGKSVASHLQGLPASAMLGDSAKSMFEAGHGTALDIAGRDVANPMACIRALGLLLRHAARRPDLCAVVEAAIRSVLGQGYRTADIHCSNTRLVGTTRMRDLIADAARSEVEARHH